MKTILLSGYYGFDNTGDEALLMSFIQQVRALGMTPIALSQNPEKTANTYNIKCFHRFKPHEVIKAMREADALVMGGGTLLQDVTSGKNVLYYVGIMRLAQWLRKPVFFLAQGGGPLQNKKWYKLIAKTLNRCAFLSARDDESRTLFTSIGVTKRFSLTSDPALALSIPSNLSVAWPFANQKKTVVFSVRPWEEDTLLERECKETIRTLVEKDVNVLVIPFHTPNDIPLSSAIVEGFPPDRVSLYKGIHTVPTILSVIQKADAVVGMRLHALVFAASQGTPFVGISYDPKIDSFLARFDQKPACTATNVSHEALILSIQHALAQSHVTLPTELQNEKGQTLRSLQEYFNGVR